MIKKKSTYRQLTTKGQGSTIKKLESIRKERNEEACQNALAELEKCAAEDGNLMALAIEAANIEQPLGRSLAMENVSEDTKPFHNQSVEFTEKSMRAMKTL